MEKHVENRSTVKEQNEKTITRITDIEVAPHYRDFKNMLGLTFRFNNKDDIHCTVSPAVARGFCRNLKKALNRMGRYNQI